MENALELLLEQDEAGGVDRDHRVGVLDEVAELRILFLADRRVERHGLLRDLLDLADLLRADTHHLADLVGGRFATEILEQLPLHPDELVDRLHHVDRDPDRPGLVGDRARDGLADPPGRIRRELVPLGIIELLDGSDQPQVALLDQVQEQHPPSDVALGDRDDQAQVRLDQLLLGQLTIPLDATTEVVELFLGLRAEALRHLVAADPLDLGERRELMLADLPDLLDEELEDLRFGFNVFRDVMLQGRRQLPRLDPPGQVHLLGRVEERDLADLLEVHPHHVVRRCAEEVDLDPDLGRGIRVVTGDLDDLDALGRQMLLDLGEELFDLFRREVLDRDGLEEVLRRDESSLAPSGDDLFLDLVDPERLTSSRRFAHQVSFAMSGTTATVYGTARQATRQRNRGRSVMTARRADAAGCAGVRRPPRRVGGRGRPSRDRPSD